MLLPADGGGGGGLLQPHLSGGAGVWHGSVGGWAAALLVLAAVRQGRVQADAERLDVRALQQRQQDSRMQVREPLGFRV